MQQGSVYNEPHSNGSSDWFYNAKWELHHHLGVPAPLNWTPNIPHATPDSSKNRMHHRSDAAAAAADAQRKAARMQHHLTYGAVGRAAWNMATAVVLNAVNIQKLHDLHPPAEPPEHPPQLPEALQIDIETLEKVRRSAPRGSAAGCSDTT
jgi:hypothetical protein